ncbi:glycosyltransferase involved in cell wall biosynthesis [Agromyces cerinus]|uniref:glycosyltransferase family 2 protein n=1 Tax=Agromyces cerinus TaxID=33878 RepID=UPI00195F13F4|nr:glycosyltransferase involved in cell wall biosynthesis [Agromyces cerinus]
MRAAQTLIVVPAFNEEGSVEAVLGEISAALPGVAVVVVDDGSQDATAAHARDAGATVLQLPFNLGVGGAMRTGFKYAREAGFEIVVQIDADGQHDPALVADLIEHLDSSDADIVIGARFAGKGDYQVRGPRRWAMSFLAGVIGRISGTRLTDTTSGFKAIGPRALALFADHYPAEYLGDTVEALVIAARAGLKIEQVPVAMRARQAGEPSHHPVKAAVYLLRAIVALGLSLLRPRITIAERGSAQ